MSIGGNLCNGLLVVDMFLVLIVLRVICYIVGFNVERDVVVEDFVIGFG